MATLLLSSHTISLCQPNLCFPRRTKKPRAVLSRTQKMQVPYELKQGQTRLFHKLPSGLNMEVIVQKGVVEKDPYDRNSENPPLVFVHGSYHAAWCWAEHWLPFFSAFGFDCYALSLLGQVASLSLSHIIYFFHSWSSNLCRFVYNMMMLAPSYSWCWAEFLWCYVVSWSSFISRAVSFFKYLLTILMYLNLHIICGIGVNVFDDPCLLLLFFLWELRQCGKRKETEIEMFIIGEVKDPKTLSLFRDLEIL